MALALILLPLSLDAIRMLHDQILLQRSRQHLAQVLPAAELCLDQASLAEGLPVLKAAETRNLLTALFARDMPPLLAGRLELTGIECRWRDLPYNPAHWMGSAQPRRLPVVIIRAAFEDCRGNLIPLHDTIEILLD